MRKYLIQLAAAGWMALFSQKAFSQCEVSAALSEQDIVCGDCTEINAFGQGQGLSVFYEDFNTGVPTGWDTTQQAVFTNPCSPGVDTTIHIWFGNYSGVPRFLTTLPYDFTPATVGVTICFDMKFASQTGTGGSACEGPDEPDEGVYLEYSTDGITWNTIHYFDPNGGYDPQLTNWTNWCFSLPQAAVSTGTRIRWYQKNDSGPDYDHWGLDNVNIYFNDPTYEIRWLNDNFSYGQGSSGGSHIVCPRTTSDYIAYMSNGLESCSDTIRIIVKDPIIELNAGDDVRVCEGSCATINATAKVIKEPAQQKTFFNNQPERIDSAETSVNINIRDLNMTTIQPNSIKYVCITQLNYLGFDIAELFANIGNPNPSIDSLFKDVSSLNVYLQCPDGTRILLVPAGVTQLPNMSFTFPSPFPPISFPFPVPDSVGYQNMCFVPAGADISTGAGTHYSDSYTPAESFNNLTGCTANGLWSLVVQTTSNINLFSSGGGTLFGWSISFDDIEISYPADFFWDPTAGLSDSNSLRPQVCPTEDIIYTLTATDSAGCVTETDSVNVTVDTTNLDLTVAITNPACNDNNGVIDLTVANGSGTYIFNWSNGDSTEDLNGVSADLYSVTVTDVAHCQEDTFFILSSVGGPFITNISATGETCRAENDGSATANAAGGTPPLLFEWSNGVSGTTITNLAPGNYTLTVTDGAGCKEIAVVSVAGGPPCCALVVDLLSADTRCANTCDGYAEAILTNGFPPFSYQWSDGNSQDLLRNDFCAGSFSITVTDRNNCTATDNINIGSPAPVVVDLGDDFTICNGNTVTLDAGDAYFAFSWSTGDTSQSITVSTTNNYEVTVTSPDNCEGTAEITVTVLDPYQVDAGEDITIVQGTRVNLNASVAGGLTGNYFWQPADSVDCSGCQNTTARPYVTTVYTVTFFDSNECTGNDSITVTVVPEIIPPVVPDAFTPNGDGRNDKLFVVFNPPNSGVVKEFRIYNRWSELVHDDETPWDGTYKGKEQPVGTFVYYAIVELIDGRSFPLSGAFSLLR